MGTGFPLGVGVPLSTSIAAVDECLSHGIAETRSSRTRLVHTYRHRWVSCTETAASPEWSMCVSSGVASAEEPQVLQPLFQELEVRVQYAGFLARLLVVVASAGLLFSVLRFDLWRLAGSEETATLALFAIAIGLLAWCVAGALLRLRRPAVRAYDQPPPSSFGFDLGMSMLVLFPLLIVWLLWTTLAWHLFVWLFDADT